MKYDIFISYRRKGGFGVARHLYDLLRHDGYSVSFDLDTLRNGNFDTQLLERIKECKDFILVLNEGALDRSVDPNFDRNNDWMRRELTVALAENKNVIPVMLPGFKGFPENLPEDISQVVRKNGPSYSDEYFDDFYEKLKEQFMQSSAELSDYDDEREGGLSEDPYIVEEIIMTDEGDDSDSNIYEEHYDDIEEENEEDESTLIETTADTIDGVVEAGLKTPLFIYQAVKAFLKQIFIEGFYKTIKKNVDKKKEKKKTKKIKRVKRVKKTKRRIKESN